MTFIQTAPRLGNQYSDDPALQAWLSHTVPGEVRAEMEPTLREMGALAGGPLLEMQRVDTGREPVLTTWSPWGERIDRIEPTPLWREAERIAAELGLVATAYDGGLGSWNRVHQLALAYLFVPSTDMYGCPLAMTDGAARTLLDAGDEQLADRAVSRLVSRDPTRFWTSGQWMTELTGGSDVGASTTVARRGENGGWELHGRKWFTSAIASPMALTLARPEGNPAGGRGLALFYVETRDEAGRMRNIRVDRLKDKLGTRKLPTAEITLEGTPARLVGEAADGVRRITPMLNVTRLWNAVSSVAYMRRGIALARDYARRREAFGARLDEQPLHLDTIAGMEAELWGGIALTFRVAVLLGRAEQGEMEEGDELLLRLLTPVAKLTTGKQAVAVCSEALECFGGAGYVEDTGLPVLLRDSQVFPIWEGTTNVLSLDTLRVLGSGAAMGALHLHVETLGRGVRDPGLRELVKRAGEALRHAERWLAEALERGRADQEAGARRFALTIGRATALAEMTAIAQSMLDADGDGRGGAACRRFARAGVDLVVAVDLEDSRALARGERLNGQAT